MIAATVAFLPGWEGMDKVAKRDAIGTGHPITYCYGQTSEFGDVKEGTTFTKSECDAKLAESLPPYLERLEKCIHVDMPDKTKASLLDASWNAGTAAVCRSPMLVKMNDGDLVAGCNAFDGWYVRSDGQVRRGLVARRAGEEHGDPRKSERALCLEGLREGNVQVVAAEPEPKIVLVPPPACNCARPVAVPAVPPRPKPKPAAHRSRQHCVTTWNVITMREENKSCR